MLPAPSGNAPVAARGKRRDDLDAPYAGVAEELFIGLYGSEYAAMVPLTILLHFISRYDAINLLPCEKDSHTESREKLPTFGAEGYGVRDQGMRRIGGEIH